MKFSPSLIKAWMACPLKAKFGYLDKLPDEQSAASSFGSAVHIALEVYNNSFDVEAAKNLFLFVWDNPEQFDITPDFYYPRTSYGEYRERGIKFIDQYHENNEWINRTILATEHRFCVPFGDHLISGIVDFMEIEKGSNVLKIVDLKTGQRPNKQNLGFDVQFTSYLYAASQREFWCGYDDGTDKYVGFENGEELFEKFKDYELVGIWFDLRNGKEYEVGPRTDSDLKKLHICLDEIARAIEYEVFVPNISGNSCGLCSFKEICPIYEPPRKGDV